ncbi:hypothetical protein RAB80_005367 [Fusarium oxysporum f. sp. vasinfectum]|nr:hypothetical protein RAB80_005367 [Fusarium oxysporum f. sp. vasinfectum]KAK2935294.1 hypothetical protein FoTM2_003235 [Fusarium oxysporum f. sp. vasinfectum]
MSSTTLSTASAVPTACTNLYDTPNQDNTCAMPFKDNHTEIMQKCCGDAKIVSYYNGCGLYCVALDQTIGELAKCLFSNGAPTPTSSAAEARRLQRQRTPTSETSTESGNAAAGFAPKSSINTLGLAIGALLFSSMAAGAFQL